MHKLPCKRSGKVKTRVFALILMLFSCSILISAYRSLSREFIGAVIRKTATTGIASTHYQLHLLPISGNFNPETLNKALADLDYPLQRVGVSAMVFEQAQTLETVEKKSLSLRILVGGSYFLDLGLFWLLSGIAGILISIWMHLQTLRKPQETYPGEEIEIPGLD